MKRLPLIAAGLALIAGVAAVAVGSSFIGTAEEADQGPKPMMSGNALAEPSPTPVLVAEANTGAAETSGETAGSDSDDTEEDKPMTDETAATRTPEQEAQFKQTIHEGDVALGVCGARVSALLWFYEASVAQGREDLKPAVASLTESRESIKAEAERRAFEDKVDTSVRVMNDESEKIWNDLNEKAGGEAEDFQKAHDELVAGVQECLSLFFERPDAEKSDATKSE